MHALALRLHVFEKKFASTLNHIRKLPSLFSRLARSMLRHVGQHALPSCSCLAIAAVCMAAQHACHDVARCDELMVIRSMSSRQAGMTKGHCHGDIRAQ